MGVFVAMFININFKVNIWCVINHVLFDWLGVSLFESTFRKNSSQFFSLLFFNIEEINTNFVANYGYD